MQSPLATYGSKYMQEAKKIKNATHQEKASSANDEESRKFLEKIDKFKSKELVIGLAFPLGTSTDELVSAIDGYFSAKGYKVVSYRLSELVENALNELVDSGKKKEFMKLIEREEKSTIYDPGNQFQRIDNLQQAGNFIREHYEPGIIAQLAIRKIAFERMKKSKDSYDELSNRNEVPEDINNVAEFSASSHYIPEKTVYIVNSLKNPSEAEMLKAVYGDLFYLIGAIQSKEERIENLASKIRVPRQKPDHVESNARQLEERDRKQSEGHQQQLDKTLNLCDFFISITNSSRKLVQSQITRFFDLVHGIGVNTPTTDEYGMYVAYTAGLGSACLSRQVGASIADSEGNIISTGCNDVPKYKGGLYIASDNIDNRCFNNGGFCRNDDEKFKIKDDIVDILESSGVTNSGAVADKIFSQARIKDLIEFSRAVHAEMEAIVSLTRRSGGSTQGATLYTTTFPCHNCARHIVAAGIQRVVFIEPYDKSLALDLHRDAITRLDESGKLPFIHFTGVSPLRYSNIFYSSGDRKDSSTGKFTGYSKTDSSRSFSYLEAYRDLEFRTHEHLKRLGLTKQS